MFIDSSILKELLLAARIASRAELDVLAEEAKAKGVSLSEIVLAQGLIGGDDLRRLEARASGVPFLGQWEDKIPYEVLAKIPEPVARAHNIIAVRETDDGLEVIGLKLGDILDAKKVLNTEQKILPRLAPESLVRKLLLFYQRERGSRFGQTLRDLGTKLSTEKSERDLGNIADLLFRDASTAGARRIMIEVTPSETAVRYRIGHKLYEAMTTNPHIGNRLVESAGFPDLFTKYDFAPVGQFATPLSKRALFNQRAGVLSELGLWGENLDAVERVIEDGGLVVVGSSDLSYNKEFFYNLAREAVRSGKNVLSIEKKLEQYLFHVEQVESGKKPVADILRQLLPYDFDTIFVEEIDSPQTLALLAGVAGRGATVVVGLVAESLVDIVAKTEKLLPDRYILSAVSKIFIRIEPLAALVGPVVAGKLEPDELKDLRGYVDLEKIKEQLVLAGLVDNNFDFLTANFKVKKQGLDLPLKDRRYIYATEGLVVDKLVAKAIGDGQKPQEIINLAKNNSFLKLSEDIFVLALQGKIDLNEAIAKLRRLK
ncbi:MAG: hypothetical protein QG665_347 [Patescibacteria group bacterium]|nr:hypothetical protein [Patescibacteria group bacterium]